MTQDSTFFSFLLRELNTRRIKHSVIGGRAAIHYKLAEFTKDYDLSVDYDSTPILIEILDNLPEPIKNVSYRLGLSAPLSKEWGSRGWTSHLELFSENGEQDRLDIFLTLPRVANTLPESTPQYHLHLLAETKKTQRDKDWNFVEAFGKKIIEAGNTTGFLHIYDAKFLRAALELNLTLPDQVLSLRPSLQLLLNGSPALELALFVEKRFWQLFDQERLKLYRNVGRPYWTQVRRVADTLAKAPLLVQHAKLTELASEYLPQNPWEVRSVTEIAEQIIQELKESLSASAENFIPELDSILHSDGVYNPRKAYEHG